MRACSMLADENAKKKATSRELGRQNNHIVNRHAHKFLTSKFTLVQFSNNKPFVNIISYFNTKT